MLEVPALQKPYLEEIEKRRKELTVELRSTLRAQVYSKDFQSNPDRTTLKTFFEFLIKSYKIKAPFIEAIVDEFLPIVTSILHPRPLYKRKYDFLTPNMKKWRLDDEDTPLLQKKIHAYPPESAEGKFYMLIDFMRERLLEFDQVVVSTESEPNPIEASVIGSQLQMAQRELSILRTSNPQLRKMPTDTIQEYLNEAKFRQFGLTLDRLAESVQQAITLSQKDRRQ